MVEDEMRANLRISRELWTRFARAAGARGENRSDLLRAWIADYVAGTAPYIPELTDLPEVRPVQKTLRRMKSGAREVELEET